jgi:hypothetical protein
MLDYKLVNNGSNNSTLYWSFNSASGFNDRMSLTSAGALTVTGSVSAERYRGINSLLLNTYTTVNPSSNVYLYGPPSDRDAWIYLDPADTGSNWGIYHRQIDSAVSGLPANSIGYIGGSTNTLQSYVSLLNGNGYYAGSLGIGTTNLTRKLTLNGDSEWNNWQYWTPTTGGEYTFAVGIAASTYSSVGDAFTILRYNSGWNTAFIIDNDTGNVGINTTGPVSRFHVNGGKIILTSDDGGYGQFQINSSSTSTEATILLSNGGSGVNLGQYSNVGVIGMGAYGGARDTLIIGTGYSGGTMSMKAGVTTFSGNVVNSASYKANTFIQLTSVATKTFSTGGVSSSSFAVTDFSGVPSNAKAISVYGWYHITGYSSGAGQGDHAVSWFGLANDTTTYSWGGPGAAWPGMGSSFTPQYYGSFSMEHDGDASGTNMTNFMHYYGSWHNGIINVNANGNIFYTLAFGYSGGTHHIALYCTGYWI